MGRSKKRSAAVFVSGQAAFVPKIQVRHTMTAGAGVL